MVWVMFFLKISAPEESLLDQALDAWTKSGSGKVINMSKLDVAVLDSLQQVIEGLKTGRIQPKELDAFLSDPGVVLQALGGEEGEFIGLVRKGIKMLRGGTWHFRGEPISDFGAARCWNPRFLFDGKPLYYGGQDPEGKDRFIFWGDTNLTDSWGKGRFLGVCKGSKHSKAGFYWLENALLGEARLVFRGSIEIRRDIVTNPFGGALTIRGLAMHNELAGPIYTVQDGDKVRLGVGWAANFDAFDQPFDDIEDIRRDAGKLSFRAKKEGKWRLYYNQSYGPEFDRISNYCMNGDDLVYFAKDGETLYLVVNHRKTTAWPDEWAHNPRYLDGHFCYDVPQGFSWNGTLYREHRPSYALPFLTKRKETFIPASIADGLNEGNLLRWGDMTFGPYRHMDSFHQVAGCPIFRATHMGGGESVVCGTEEKGDQVGKIYDDIFSLKVDGDVVTYGARKGRKLYQVTRKLTVPTD